MGSLAEGLGRTEVLVRALTDAWRTSTVCGHAEPVVFLRGDLGEHRAWPEGIALMTRAEAEVLMQRDLAYAAYPASEVMMISPTERALRTTVTFAAGHRLVASLPPGRPGVTKPERRGAP